METKDTYLENKIENIYFCVSEAKNKIESAIDYTYLTGYESDIRSALRRALELLDEIDSSSKEIKENYNKKDIEISDLELTYMVQSCLRNAHIKTVQQLVNLSEKDLLKIRNFGKKRIREIKDRLKEHGLSLRENEEGER